MKTRARQCVICRGVFTVKFPSDSKQTCNRLCFGKLIAQKMTGTTRLNQKPWSREARQRHRLTMKRVWARRKR